MENQDLRNNRRCALAIAHPGHELRVHGWLAANQPRVYVLTDGSGRHNDSRINSTANLLTDVGAVPGFLFGTYQDREIYSHVLAGNSSLFKKLSELLAKDWVLQEIDVVVGDAFEGAIMTHDLWRGVIDRAVEIASEIRGLEIENIGFSLESPLVLAQCDAPIIHSSVELDDGAWRRKIRAALSYSELQHEVQAAFLLSGKEVFRNETFLIPSRRDFVTPEYERYAERLAESGVYKQVVRYQQHVRPILEELKITSRAA